MHSVGIGERGPIKVQGVTYHLDFRVVQCPRFKGVSIFSSNGIGSDMHRSFVNGELCIVPLGTPIEKLLVEGVIDPGDQGSALAIQHPSLIQ